MSELDNLDFNTRDEYFSWRAEWRKDYENISLQIRKFKQKRNQLFRSGEFAGNTQNLLMRYEYEAFCLLDLRMVSKKKSAEQREKRITQLAA